MKNAFFHYLDPGRSALSCGLGLMGILLLGLLIYSNSLDIPFYFDDTQHITENPHIRITELSWDSLREAAQESPHPRRFMVYLTFALNYYAGGLDPTGFHVTSVAIHLFNGVLIFWFVMLVLTLPSVGYDSGKARSIALCTALLWLLNPIHTQSVSYVIQRSNLLAVTFYLLAFIAYIHARLSRSLATRLGLACTALIAGLAAQATKEIAAVLPFFVVLFEWFFFQDLQRDWVRRKLGWLILALVLFAATAYAYLGADAFQLNAIDRWYAGREFTLSERLLTESRVVLFYLGLLAYPHPDRLNLTHDFPLSNSLLDPLTTLVAIALIAATLVQATFIARKERLIAFLIIWYFGHLLLESSVIPLEIIFEHRTYLPSLGPVLLSVLLVSRLKPSPALAWAMIGLWSATLAYWAFERNETWRDPVAFWSDAAAKSPDLVRPHNNLGAALQRAGQTDEAFRAFTNAIEAHDRHRLASRSIARPSQLTTSDWLQSLAYTNRGSLLEERGDYEAAKRDFDAAIRIAPDKSTLARLHRGITHQRVGNLVAAAQDYSEVIRKQPKHYLAYSHRGQVYTMQGRYGLARQDLDTAIRLNPNYARAYGYRGNLRHRVGDVQGAISDYKDLLRLEPRDPLGYSNLGAAYQSLGFRKEALVAFRQALRLAPEDWSYRHKVRELVATLESE